MTDLRQREDGRGEDAADGGRPSIAPVLETRTGERWRHQFRQAARTVARIPRSFGVRDNSSRFANEREDPKSQRRPLH